MKLWVKLGLIQTPIWIVVIALLYFLVEDWGLPVFLNALTCVQVWAILFFLRDVLEKMR